MALLSLTCFMNFVCKVSGKNLKVSGQCLDRVLMLPGRCLENMSYSDHSFIGRVFLGNFRYFYDKPFCKTCVTKKVGYIFANTNTPRVRVCVLFTDLNLFLGSVPSSKCYFVRA